MCVLVYVDMGLSSNNPVVITVVTAGPSFSRTFSVKITQIECNSLSKGRAIIINIIINNILVQLEEDVCSTSQELLVEYNHSTTTTQRGSSCQTQTTLSAPGIMCRGQVELVNNIFKDGEELLWYPVHCLQ